eukprot:7714346-Pyramimonas_sp.AAC.1
MTEGKSSGWSARQRAATFTARLSADGTPASGPPSSSSYARVLLNPRGCGRELSVPPGNRSVPGALAAR